MTQPTVAEHQDPAVDPVKVIYLVRRRPGDDHDSFVRRWRQHGALAMSMSRWSNVLKYAHCDVLGEVDPSGLITESPYDGIGMSWFRSAAHFAAHISDDAAQVEMTTDEVRTFGAVVAPSMLVCRESVLRDDTESPAFKIVRAINRTAGLGESSFAESWPRYAGQLPNDNGQQVARHLCNVIDSPAAEGSPLKCDLIDELGFLSFRGLEQYAGRNNVTSLSTDESGEFASARAFVTNEVMLYESRCV